MLLEIFFQKAATSLGLEKQLSGSKSLLLFSRTLVLLLVPHQVAHNSLELYLLGTILPV